jgi:hypothetical protein
MTAASFASWRPPERRITWQELLREPVPPQPKPVPPRIDPLPPDTWRGTLCEFEAYVDELLDRQEAAAAELEAAE